MLDLSAVYQRIPPYYSVFVTFLKLFLTYSGYTNVYQCTCRFFHKSAYVGAIRRSVTGRGPFTLQETRSIHDSMKLSKIKLIP